MAYDLIAKLKLIDNMSAPLRKVENGMKSMDNASKSLSSNLKQMGDAGAKSFNSMTLSAGQLVKAYAVVKTTQAAIKFAGDSMGKALDYEAELSTIKALTGATNDQMKQMSDLALNMGAKTKYSALQAAQGIEELLKAGLTPAAVQAGGLEAALNLATAGGLDLSEAAVVMSTALNGFKKDGMTAADASNILAGAANASATGVHELGYALASVGSVADMVGMSFKEVNAAIGLMANDGLKNGSDAGTSFKSMLMYLQPQTDKAATLFEKLGLGVGKANKFFKDGKVKDLAGLAEQLHTTFAKFNDQDRTAIFMDMFGTDGVRAATSLYKAGAKGVKEFYNEMGNVTALQVATEKMNNGLGAIEQFKGALETLQIRALMPLLPAIKYAFNGMGDFINAKTPQITASIQKMADTAKTYLKTHFIDNPEFNKLTTFESRVSFVFDSIKKSFDTWYNAGGNKQISDATNSLIGFLSDALEGSSGKLTSIGIKLGTSVASGMFDGIKQFANANPELASILTFMATPGSVPVKLTAAGLTLVTNEGNKPAVVDTVKKMNDPVAQQQNYDTLNKQNRGIEATTTWIGNEIKKGLGYVLDPIFKPKEPIYGPPIPKHAGGLDRVPYNGYVAELHKDERIQTAAEANAQREGRVNGGYNGPLVHVENLHVRQDSDIDLIAGALARQINAGVSFSNG